MSQDLTYAPTERQNIINNPFALQEIEQATLLQDIACEQCSVVLKEQVAAFLVVTVLTVDSYLEKFGDELRRDGYEVLRSKRSKELKKAISESGANETDFVTTTTILGLFRVFLNRVMPAKDPVRGLLFVGKNQGVQSVG